MKLRGASRVQRLARVEERAVIRRIFYLSILSVGLAIFLFTLAVPILGKFADILDSIFENAQDQQKSRSVSDPPRLDDLPTATNSATLSVSGFADEGTTIIIFLDEENVGQTLVEGGKFTFDDLTLKVGDNKIAAKATIGDAESDFSNAQTVIFDKEEPKLTVEMPADGQSFSGNNRIQVKGETDKDAQVYANGFLATVSQEGKFEVFVPIAEGETSVEIKAIDEAGNTKIENRKVFFRK